MATNLRAFGVPTGRFTQHNGALSMGLVQEQARSGMEAVKSMQGSVARVSDAVRGDAAVQTAGESAVSAAAIPVVEISDEDYRSFCLPCNALEDDSDCERGT